MVWDEYAYLIPFILITLGVLYAIAIIRRVLYLRKSGWKPLSSKNEEETTLQAALEEEKNDLPDSSVLSNDGSWQENATEVQENVTELQANVNHKQEIEIPPPDIPIGPTIFEIMDGKEFTSTWQLHGHGFLSKVLDLYMCLGAELNNFQIAAGVGQNAGQMFDTLAFQHDVEEKKSFCFVRVVETVGSPTRKITAKDLKSSKDPTFSLIPLFESYIGIRQQFTNAGIDPSHIGFLTVLTNAVFERSKFEFLDTVEEPPKKKKRKSKPTVRKLSAQEYPFSLPNSYQIRIPDKKLKHYTGSDETLKILFLEFLEKLVFVLDVDGSQIDETIMDVLNHKFNLVECRFIFHEMLGVIRNLPKQPTERVVGEVLKLTFQEIRQRLQRIYCSGAVLENHCNGLFSEDYFKSYEPINGVLQARANSEDDSIAPLICISTKTTALTSLKVAYCLQQIFGPDNVFCDRFAVLDTLSLLKNRERVEDTFRSRREFVLVIKWTQVGANMKAEVDVLVAKFIDMATNTRKGERKTVVLIEDINKDYTDIKIYAEKCKFLEDKCEFINFRDEIKTQLMKNKFQFEGEVISLSEVITAWEIKSLESRVFVLNQLIEDGQRCFSINYVI